VGPKTITGIKRGIKKGKRPKGERSKLRERAGENELRDPKRPEKTEWIDACWERKEGACVKITLPTGIAFPKKKKPIE